MYDDDDDKAENEATDAAVDVTVEGIGAADASMSSQPAEGVGWTGGGDGSGVEVSGSTSFVCCILDDGRLLGAGGGKASMFDGHEGPCPSFEEKPLEPLLLRRLLPALLEVPSRLSTEDLLPRLQRSFPPGPGVGGGMELQSSCVQKTGHLGSEVKTASKEVLGVALSNSSDDEGWKREVMEETVSNSDDEEEDVNVEDNGNGGETGPEGPPCWRCGPATTTAAPRSRSLLFFASKAADDTLDADPDVEADGCASKDSYDRSAGP
jgi:hypothetical protein